jgi:ABC-type multidrug transport system fused ATPase/permease subunit
LKWFTLCSCIFRESAAVVPQSCWILNASVRDNILFGRSFDLERYNEVLYASSLVQDLKLFENGDLTEIGEKVSNQFPFIP